MAWTGNVASPTLAVTADHGMGDDGNHAGPTPQETHVPFYALGFRLGDGSDLRQTEIAGLICRLMRIDPGLMARYSGEIGHDRGVPLI